jgi:putative transposase
VTETNVFGLTQPGTFSEPLTEVLRNGARTLLGQAVEAEVAAWLSTHTDKLTDDGRRQPGRGDCLSRARHLAGPIQPIADRLAS